MLAENRLLLRPLTIGLLMVIETSILLFSEMLVYWCMLSFSFLILFFMHRKKVLSFGVTYLVLFAGITFLSKGFAVNQWAGAIYTMILIVVKLFPLWILAGIAMAFNTSEIIASLRKLRLPNHLCIGIAIFIRFIPEYRRYVKEIKEGLKVRNIGFRLAAPIRSIELYLVPMIYKAFETGDTLTSALLTKGIEFDGRKTSYVDLSLTWRDCVAILVGLGLIGIMIWEKQ